MLYEAFLAGVWASVGSTLGKLTGTTSVVVGIMIPTIERYPGFPGDSYLLWGGLLVAMVLANTWGCRHYLRSLDAAPNSVAPTVVSAASSYVLSGFIGILLFEESSTLLWWAGAMLIITGLGLVAKPQNKTNVKIK